MLDIFRTLPGLLKDLEGAELIREAVVFAAWRRIAGEALAEHAVPLKLENETLSVAVSNITWQRHLKDLCGQMIFKLNAALGTQAVTFIRLQIDDLRRGGLALLALATVKVFLFDLAALDVAYRVISLFVLGLLACGDNGPDIYEPCESADTCEVPEDQTAECVNADGTSYLATIETGDIDPWTFSANAGEYVIVRMGEVTTTGFTPWLRLYSPNGVLLDQDFNAGAAEVAFRATNSGVSAVVVGDTEVDEEPWAVELADDLAVDPHAGGQHPLDDGTHVVAPARVRRG